MRNYSFASDEVFQSKAGEMLAQSNRASASDKNAAILTTEGTWQAEFRCVSSSRFNFVSSAFAFLIFPSSNSEFMQLQMLQNPR